MSWSDLSGRDETAILPTTGARMPDRPNVLLVLVDELRHQALGSTGDPNARTPALDALAAESVVYDQAVSGHPICCPARASIMTGQYSPTHGVVVNDVPVRTAGPTLAGTFAEAGYATGYIGKWHLYGSPQGLCERREDFVPPEARLGYQYWAAGECTHEYNSSTYYQGDDPTPRQWAGYDALAQTEHACGYLRDRVDRSEPFFLTVAYGPPHFPYRGVPERYKAMYRDAELEVRPNVPDDLREAALAELRGYHAQIAGVDDCVAELLSCLARTGLADDTIVVFTSDHGDMAGSQGLEHKLCPWEEAVRVPLFVRFPDRRRTGTDSALVNSPDLMPTLLGLAGVPVPAGLQGIDFSSPAADRPATALLTAPIPFSTMRSHGFAAYRGVRNARYVYVRSSAGPWLLYDLETDPFQLSNRCGDPAYADVQAWAEEELDAWLQRTGDDFPSGDRLLEVHEVAHYYEVNEPLGVVDSPWGDWAATDRRGERWSVDASMADLAADATAREVVDRHCAGLLDLWEADRAGVFAGVPPIVGARRSHSPRTISLVRPDLVPPGELPRLDEALAGVARTRPPTIRSLLGILS